MQVLYERCAAVDVGKDVIAVAVRLPGDGPDGRQAIKRTFKTFYGVLAEAARWLASLGVTHVAMEATRIYSMPVYHALIEHGNFVQVLVCNAGQVKNVPGRKTDLADADLGADPAGAEAAASVAGVLPRCAGGLRGPGCAGCAGAAGQGSRPGPGRQADPAQVAAALKRARRRDIAGKTDAILAALRGDQLHQPQLVASVYAAAVSSLTVIIAALGGEIAAMERQVTACFRGHPDAGLGDILGARELGEFGDDPHRYASAKARKNYAATSPVTRQSGKKKIVMARFIRNDRLAAPEMKRSLCQA
jgi:transposase